MLASFKVVVVAGAPMEKGVGDALAARNVQLFVGYGSCVVFLVSELNGS